MGPPKSMAIQAARARILFAITAVATGIAALAIGPSVAFGCSQSSHCYGTVRWTSTPDYYGGIAALQVARLEQSNMPGGGYRRFRDSGDVGGHERRCLRRVLG